MTEAKTIPASHLIAPLPQGNYFDPPDIIDRFFVQIQPDGCISFVGSAQRITDFLKRCDELGLVIEIDHINMCG